MRAPQTERGPVNSSGVPSAGAATQIASEAVPVPGKPASASACDLASVAVITALTNAASASGTGTATTTLIVPGRHADRGWATSSSQIGCSSGSAWPSGAAAQVGTRRPTVAVACAPASTRQTYSVTAAAVSRPTPGPARPRPALSSARWATGSIRL